MMNEFMELYVICGPAWFIRGLLMGIWNMNLGTSPGAVEVRKRWVELQAELSKSAPHPAAFQIAMVLAWVAAVSYLATKSVVWPIDVVVQIKKASS